MPDSVNPIITSPLNLQHIIYPKTPEEGIASGFGNVFGYFPHVFINVLFILNLLLSN